MSGSYEEIRRSFPPVDRAVLTERGAIHEAVAFVKESMRQGTRGACRITSSSATRGAFRPRQAINVPAQIWEGTEDHTGPPGYREFLLRRIAAVAGSSRRRARVMCRCSPTGPRLLSELVSSGPARSR